MVEGISNGNLWYAKLKDHLNFALKLPESEVRTP